MSTRSCTVLFLFLSVFVLSAATSGLRFIQGDPTTIFIGMTPLKKHLNQAGIHSPFVVAELLDAQDWTVFEQRYALTGLAPYAPRAMLGLILYGIVQGVSSLNANRPENVLRGDSPDV